MRGMRFKSRKRNDAMNETVEERKEDEMEFS
jgi:hypothetical protein